MDMKRIKLGEFEYPMHCSLLVLEKLQEKFGTIEAWEKDVLKPIPAPTAVITGVVEMVNEGIEIFNEKTKMEKIEPVTKSVLRNCGMTVFEMRAIIHEEFMSCFERKNAETTQTMTDISQNTKSQNQ